MAGLFARFDAWSGATLLEIPLLCGEQHRCRWLRNLEARMDSSMLLTRPEKHKTRSEVLPRSLPEIQLTHGRALWVLSEMGFRGAATKRTFNYYIKSLRKFGLPFTKGQIGRGRRHPAIYSYNHLMELALALTLRVYYFLPDAFLEEIIRCRPALYRLYRMAYQQRCTGRGAPIEIACNGRRLTLQGTFLDLQIDYAGGELTRFGPPRLLSPFDALAAFAASEVAARAFLPIKLSTLSEQVVTLALEAPMIRPSRHPAHSEGTGRG
jgi:hypothetical protein